MDGRLTVEHRHLDVACDLEAADASAQLLDWRQLIESAGLGFDSVPGGSRLWLRAEAVDMAEALVRREAACCGFLDFDLAFDGDRLRLDITSIVPHAAPVVSAIFGLESPRPE